MSTSSFFTGGESPQTNIYEDEAKASADAAAVSAAEAAGSAAQSATSADEAAGQALYADQRANAALASQNAASTSATNAANSASAASTSASNAATSASGSSTSATNAATSASAAAGSATSASTSATNAANSASAAAGSATDAASSTSAASTSATNAASSATSASGSAATATAKASEAATSAANAATSASAAAGSATSASGSATSASGSASSASTSATNAANSATAAANSASAASTSATNAASAQTAAESARDATLAAFDSFDDRYLGPKTSNPTVDNDGNALVAGALYFNSVDSVMKVYTGTVWTAAYVAGTDVLLKFNNLSDVANAATARSNLVAAKSGSNDDITSINGITDGISSPDYVQFSTTGATPNVGRVMWNDTDGTLEFQLKGGNVNLQIGQEQVIRATNSTGSTVGNGTVVYISGSTGNHVNVVKAQANSETTSSKTLGVVTESIADNQSGFVTTSGLVRDLDTSALTEGAAVWLSATTAGGLTPTRPAAPNHAVLIGWCVKSHASVGVIYVHVMNGYELDELHDVLLTSAANNDVLSYDSTSGLWKNRALATVANTGALSDTTGTLGVTRGGTGTSTQFTAGSVVFAGASGVYSQDNAQLFWDDTNNRLGIGTSSPGAKLDVVGAGVFKVDGSGTTTPLILRNNNTASVQAVKLGFDSNGAIKSSINAAVYGNDYMTFNVGSDTERMRIDASGNVGIGTTNPAGWRLKLDKADAQHLNMFNTAGNGVRINMADQSWQAEIEQNAGNLLFKTGGTTERMRIDGSGNVGIGTGSPTERLTVNGTITIRDQGTSTAQIRAVNSGGTFFHGIDNSIGSSFGSPYAAALWHSGAYPMLFATNSTERMRIDGSGNVGIGTSSPSVKLDVSGGHIRMDDGYKLRWGDGTAAWEGSGASDVLIGYTNNTERMRIDSSGNVLIGTTAAVDNNFSLELNAGTSSIRGMGVNNNGGYGVYLTYDNTGRYSTNGAAIRNIANSPLYFETNNALRATLDTSGNLGLGVTPSASSGASKVIEIGAAGNTIRSGANDVYLTSNAYYDIGWKYGGTAAASYYNQTAGIHAWYTAASGTAGNAITFTQAMTLDASGRLGIGVTPVTNRLVMARGQYLAWQNTGTLAEASGITADTSDNMIFFNNGTERARIDSSGNLLVGTTANPQNSKLMVSGTAQVKPAANNSLEIFGPNTGTGIRLFARNDAGIPNRLELQGGQVIFPLTTGADGLYFDATSGNVGIGTSSPENKLDVVSAGSSQIRVKDGVGATSYYDFGRDGTDGLFGFDGAQTTLVGYKWKINGAEKMRITSAGNVGIGTSSPSYQLQLSLNSAAKPTSNVWTVVSDERVKTVTGEYTKGLDAVCSLRPVTYKYNGKAGFVADGAENISIIAQEAREVFPECIGTFSAKLNETDEEETELLNWDGHALTFALVNAIKELRAQNEDLRARVAALEGK